MRKLAQVTAWLTFSAGLMMIYLSFVLFDFFPASAGGARTQIYLLNFVGTLLGALVGPLFLPLPRNGREPVQGKKPWVSAIFIFLIILPNIIIRSFGVEFWLNSILARSILAIDSGTFYAVGYGLFFLTQLRIEADSGENRTTRFCSFWMATALMTAVLIHLGAISLLEYTGLASNPLGVMNLLFKALKWLSLGLGISAVLCVVAFSKISQGNPGARRTDTDASSKSPGFRAEHSENPSDWSMIARLVGLSATFTLLNSLLEMRLFPLVSGVVGAYEPFFLAVVPAVLLLCFLVGRSRLFIGRTAGGFLRFLLMSMMLLFILLPNLHFSKEYPTATIVMNSLVSIFRFSMWVIFTTAVVELYRGRRWFYMCAVAVFMTHSVSFFGPFLGPFIPKGAAFTVLITATAAAVFVLLGFRTLFPSLRLPAESLPEPADPPAPSLDHIFREYGLTEREIEIARLIVTEGLSNAEIAERISRATVTVEKHITTIYRKFKVDNRVAFVTKFMNK